MLMLTKLMYEKYILLLITKSIGLHQGKERFFIRK